LDGIVATDNGVQNTAPTFTPNLDAIGEMKALLSNYQAEYGVRAGARFHRVRDRLFFFWPEEWLMNKNPSSLGRVTFPTALERQGNFSQFRKPRSICRGKSSSPATATMH
jgi:hypothetical protein